MFVESVNLEIGALQSFELGAFQVSPDGRVFASVTLHGEDVQNVVTAVQLELSAECVEQLREALMIELNKKYPR